MALLAVLLLLLIVGGSSVVFISFMHRHQARAGARYRAAAALSLAEAGVHHATSLLESAAREDPGHDGAQPRRAYAESQRVGPLLGRFVVSLADEPDGSVLITSLGEVGGVARRVRARVYLASPALLVALYGSSVVRLENPPAATVVLPYSAGLGDRPWTHIAAGREIWFATTAVSINDPSAVFDVSPGPIGAPDSAGHALGSSRPGPVRLLLARGAALTLDHSHQPVDIQQLRARGVYVQGAVLREEALPELPEVEREFYRALAATNTANAPINEAAGRYHGDGVLALKRDSLYTQVEFEQVLAYLAAGIHPSRLGGVVYATGHITLLDSHRLEITDGSLIVDGSLRMNHGAVLRITHSPSTRTLPGVVVLGRLGRLIITEGAQLYAHGLVYANRSIDVIDGGRVDVVGAVVGNDPELSFRNRAATVLIRYDPGVLGTPGLRVPHGARVIAWIAEWKEVPEGQGALVK